MSKIAKYHVTFINESDNGKIFYSCRSYTITDDDNSNKPLELYQSTIESMIEDNLKSIPRATWCSVIGLVKISETVEKQPRFSNETIQQMYLIFIVLILLINLALTYY